MMYLTSLPRTPRHTEMSDDVASTKRNEYEKRLYCSSMPLGRSARRRCVWPLACAPRRAVECV